MPTLYLLKQAFYSKYSTAFYSYVLHQDWIYRAEKRLQELVFSIMSLEGWFALLTTHLQNPQTQHWEYVPLFLVYLIW